MSNTVPTFISSSAGHIGATPNMPSNILDYDVVIGATRDDGSNNNTYTVNSPWQGLSLTSNGRFFLAWAMKFPGQTLPNLAVTPSIGSSNFGSMAFLFRNNKITNAIGHTANNGSYTASGTSLTCPAITASADHSMNLLFVHTGGSTFTWPPSGYTSIDNQPNNGCCWIGSKTLVNSGDSSGALSATLSGSDWYGAFNLELQGYQPPPSDYYFNAFPVMGGGAGGGYFSGGFK